MLGNNMVIKKIKGIETLILREDQWGGYESIEIKKLTMKMSEIFSEEALIELAKKAVRPLVALKNMTFIAYIKSDIANKDVSGWRQHKQTLKDEGFDV